MKNYKAWEYRKGFRLKNGNMVYGFTAMFFYTAGFIKYHLKSK